MRHNFYMFSLYHNHDLDDRIFHSILTSVAVIQDDVHSSFLFGGDLNGHHQEWLGSTSTALTS